MRCSDCNKFVGNEEADPEVDNVEFKSGSVTTSVRITNNCAECSNELSEATFDMEQDVSAVTDKHTCASKPENESPCFEAEEDSSERTSRSGYYKKGVWVASAGRYAKTFYGAQVEVSVKCTHCGETVTQVTLADDVQASFMHPLN